MQGDGRASDGAASARRARHDRAGRDGRAPGRIVTGRPAGDPPTVDVDHHSDDFHRERHARWAELRRCPVAWNTRYGGFWMVGGYDEVTAVARDAETFSSRHRRVPRDRADAADGDPAGDIDFIGIAGIPRSRAVPTAGIAEVEGSLHAALRRVLDVNSTLAPPAGAAALLTTSPCGSVSPAAMTACPGCAGRGAWASAIRCAGRPR